MNWLIIITDTTTTPSSLFARRSDGAIGWMRPPAATVDGKLYFLVVDFALFRFLARLFFTSRLFAFAFAFAFPLSSFILCSTSLQLSVKVYHLARTQNGWPRLALWLFGFAV